MTKLATVLLIVFAATFAAAQDPKQQPQQTDEPLIVPTRPTIATPARIARKGILQVEAGSSTAFESDQFDSQEQTPATVYYSATDKLRFDLIWDGIASEVSNGVRETGPGDTRLGLKYVVTPDKEHPGFALAYHVKAPTASESKGLGTGEIDHEAEAFISRKWQKVEVDVTGAYLNVGQAGGHRSAGGLGALSGSVQASKNAQLTVEVSGESRPWTEPEGAYALGALSYNLGRLATLDAGLRFGLTHGAPRVAVVAGITFGIDFLRGNR